MVANQPLSPYVLQLDITVGEIRADYIVSKLNISHTYNKATTLTMECVGSFSADLFRIGAMVKVAGSHGFGDEIEGGQVLTHRGSEVLPLRFNGIVRMVKPKYNSVIVTCTDMISTLATGKVQNYKAIDYVGQDLYYVAKTIFDDFNETNTNYGSDLGSHDFFGGKWFDTSLLTEGSDIIDLVNNYSDNEYYNWKYHVAYLNKVHFYYNDVRSFNPKVTHVLNEDRAGVMVKGLQAQIDTSRMVNSCSITSSSDNTIIGDHEDTNSINKYGKMSKTISLNSTDAGYLHDQAYILVERYKRPTTSYSLKTGMNFMFLPSDIVKLTAPSVGIEEALPVEQVDFSLNNGSIETTVVLGERQLPIDELIQRNL